MFLTFACKTKIKKLLQSLGEICQQRKDNWINQAEFLPAILDNPLVCKEKKCNGSTDATVLDTYNQHTGIVSNQAYLCVYNPVQ